MDPLFIISGCAGLITAIGSLSVSINTFVRSCREARSDLDRVSRELHSLQTVLELIEEDAKDDTKPFPPTIQHHVSGIVTNCGSVVLEVETCIRKYGDGRIKSKASWAINGQGDMEKLRSSLEAHKSALELALDMLSLSLTKDIKTDTSEIRNDTAAIKDDTALILQEIAELQARLPDTAVAQNDYILQRFLEDMATYTETTLDANVSYSDGMSSRALSIVDEHDETSPKSLQRDLPILATQHPSALEASALSNRTDALGNAVKHLAPPKSHDHGRAQHLIPTVEDIPHRPKGPGPAPLFGSDPQEPRLSALPMDSRNKTTQNQIAPSPARNQKEWPRENHIMTGMNDVRAESDRGHSLPNDSLQTNPVAWNPPPLSQKLRSYMVPTSGPVPKQEDEAVTLPPRTEDFSRQEGSHIVRFRGNVVVDIPVPERILDQIPRSSSLGRNEFTHSRFSFITCPPEEFGDHDYTLRATLFAQPRQTQFILVVQVNPDDKDFIRRWDLIHDSIIFTQKKLEMFGDSHEFWKRVVVHLHLTHGTDWGHIGFDHSLSALKAIAGNLTPSGRLTPIGSEHQEPMDMDSSEIEGRPVYATMSEYTVQLRHLHGVVVRAEVPVQVVITTARVPEGPSVIHWSHKYIPWTCAINKVLQAEHVINMSRCSDASLTQTDFLWEVLRKDRLSHALKYNPLSAWHLSNFQV